jgi:hypothetical protein
MAIRRNMSICKTSELRTSEDASRLDANDRKELTARANEVDYRELSYLIKTAECSKDGRKDAQDMYMEMKKNRSSKK